MCAEVAVGCLALPKITKAALRFEVQLLYSLSCYNLLLLPYMMFFPWVEEHKLVVKHIQPYAAIFVNFASEDLLRKLIQDLFLNNPF